MNYEKFAANAKNTYRDFCSMDIVISHAKPILAAVPDLVGKNERLEKAVRDLKAENARLKAELDDRKGFEPGERMELPVDADGEPIRIGDKMDVDGDAMTVFGYHLYKGELLLVVKKAESDVAFYTPKPSKVRHCKPEVPKPSSGDCWEKIMEDAAMTVCKYAGQEDSLDCSECRWSGNQTDCEAAMRCELVDRARKVANAEKEAKHDEGQERHED